MSHVIEVRHLTKAYGNVTALNQVSFSVAANKIYGLLGRNGAGKTTLMQIITAQLFATSGVVQVFGEAPYENRRALSQICFVKESQKYPSRYRVSDVLEQATLFFPQWDREYAGALAEDFQLPLNQRMKALSRGMLSATGIIVGLASRAPLTIFDEPYLGLDAIARSIFYNRLLEEYAKHPRTIILSTHLIDEVSRLLEHVLVLDQGRLIIDAETDALRQRAFTVTGAASQVTAFVAGKTQIGGEQFGPLAAATILEKADASERRQATALGLEVMPISLQQLIVHLTSTPPPRKELELV